MYLIKEIFYSIQGEGFHAGRAAVFCRFAGCNLWSGKEEERLNSLCSFCDTDFMGTDGQWGGRYENAEMLARKLKEFWPRPEIQPFVVCTGGEPLLQLDKKLIDALGREGFVIAVETNGTIAAPEGLDWICVSPKAKAPLKQICGDELKLVYPQTGLSPEIYEKLNFRHFFLQPLDEKGREGATRQCLKYALAHPRWSISLQLHKILNVK